MEVLSFNPKVRKGGANSHTVHYSDFVISDCSLFEMLNLKRFDLAGIFGDTYFKNYQRQLVSQMLGESPTDLESGRHLLYVCPECGDIGCGAITTEIIFDSKTVTWKKFGYENGYEAIDYDYFSDENLIFTFDFEQYRKVLSEIKNML